MNCKFVLLFSRRRQAASTQKCFATKEVGGWECWQSGQATARSVVVVVAEDKADVTKQKRAKTLARFCVGGRLSRPGATMEITSLPRRSRSVVRQKRGAKATESLAMWCGSGMNALHKCEIVHTDTGMTGCFDPQLLRWCVSVLTEEGLI